MSCRLNMPYYIAIVWYCWQFGISFANMLNLVVHNYVKPMVKASFFLKGKEASWDFDLYKKKAFSTPFVGFLISFNQYVFTFSVVQHVLWNFEDSG